MDPSLDQIRGLVNTIGSANLYAEVNRQLSWNATPAAVLAYIEAHYSTVPAVKAFNEANNITFGSSGVGATTTTWQPATSTAPTITTAPSTTVPIAAPAPPIVQSPALVRPTINLAGAAGGQLINTVAAGTSAAATSANLPNVLTADASDADNQNPLLIPADAFAESVLDDVGDMLNSRPNCDDDDSSVLNFLQNVVEYAASYFASMNGLPGIDARIPPNVWQRIHEGKEFIWRARGKVVHRGAARLLDEWFPDQWEHRNGGKYNGGPDEIHVKTDNEVELKSEGEFKRTMARRAGERARGGTPDPLYDHCGWAQYRW